MEFQIKSKIINPIFKINCLFCNAKDTEEEKLGTIYEDDKLRVVLQRDHHNWLGQCVIILAEHITPKQLYAERSEILIHVAKIIDILNKTMTEVFDMDLSNIAQLGNMTRDEKNNKTAIDGYFHTHWHFIPRYQGEKRTTILDHTFIDQQWGEALNLALKDKYVPSDEMISELKSRLVPVIQKYSQSQNHSEK